MSAILTVAGLERRISDERRIQGRHIDQLDRLRARNAGLTQDLALELSRLDEVASRMRVPDEEDIWDRLRSALSFLPGMDLAEDRGPSVEALLRAQYQISQVRVAEAADFADGLEVAERELYDEITRLNTEIIAAATAELAAAKQIREADAAQKAGRAELAKHPPGSVAARMCQADLDRLRRVLAEAGDQMRLQELAAERLTTLKMTTQQLSEALRDLRQDVSRYVGAASQHLDTISIQINAIGAAADAAHVMGRLEEALSGMSVALAEATRFVADTQRYFDERVDDLVADLAVYDGQTRAVLSQNRADAEAEEGARANAALTHVRRL